jgi:D-amino peptidase
MGGMRRVLVVADLEGIAGVDQLEDLVVGAPGYPTARELLTAELRAAIEGFRAAGFEAIRISDSHRAGSSTANVLADRLPDGIELVYQEDAYAPEVLDGVDAVACVGMHAAADTAGFAAHTLTFHCRFALGDRLLSESDIVLGLAAERGIPLIFVSGCDVLAASLPVPFVVTKTSAGLDRATSRDPAEVHAALRAAAAGAPVPATALAAGDWIVGLKSRWQERIAPQTVASGPTTASRYQAALALLAPTERPFTRAIRTFAPTPMREDVVATLRRSFTRIPEPDSRPAAHRALASFLRLTDGDAEWQLADRALALHLLGGIAPRFFAEAHLAPTLQAAVDRLDRVPAELPDELDPHAAMWRMDAAYVRAERGGPARLDRVQPYVRSIGQKNTLAAWLIWEMGVQIGLCPPSKVPPRPLRPYARVQDLYWLTHLFFLAIRYGARPFDPTGWEAETEELLLAVPWVLAEQRLDLAAEIAVCLQLSGERDSREHGAILSALLAAQRDDGAVIDPSPGPDVPARASHSTEVALFAFAEGR